MRDDGRWSDDENVRGDRRGPDPAAVSDRMMRVMAARQPGPGVEIDQVLIWVAATMAVCVGAWWTASAAWAGEPAAMLLRFGVSVFFGLYYWLISAFVRGQSA